MANSQNGLSTTFTVHDWHITDKVVIPLRNDAVGWSLAMFALWFNDVIEPLVTPGCWGWDPKDTPIGSSGVISNHGSGSAEDLNAPKHVQGGAKPDGYTYDKIAKIHARLAWMHKLATGVKPFGADSNGGNWVWRWGYDYHSAEIDGMHFEYNRSALTPALAFHHKAWGLPRGLRLSHMNPNAFGGR